MAAPEPAKRRKAAASSALELHKHLPHAYVADVVSARELRRFMHENGGGDSAVAWVAGRQLALATVRQLQLAGIGRGAIASRAARGLLHRLYRGVYLVGHPIPPPGARELGAVLACGPGALVSHQSAAGLWGLLAEVNGPPSVTSAGRRSRLKGEFLVHGTRRLEPGDVRHKNGIPVTAPARTLIDLAADVDDSELDRALNEARALKLLRDGDLDGALKRAGNRRGVGRLRTLLRAEGEFGYTRSAAERRMRKVIADARLPRPIANAPLEGFVVDFLWPQFKLVVEVDSYAFHGHRGAFERDRRKDMVLLAAGFLVVRVTWRQLVHEPIAVAAVLASAITARRAHS